MQKHSVTEETWDGCLYLPIINTSNYLFEVDYTLLYLGRPNLSLLLLMFYHQILVTEVHKFQ